MARRKRFSAPTPQRQVSVDLDSADRPFDNIVNFRDVGKSVNHLHGASILNEGVLFRSAKVDDASERDKKRLVDELHISTVIDLRSNTEHQMATRQRRAETLPGPEQTQTPVDSIVDPRDHLVDLPGVRRVLISLTGRAFEKALLWRLDWYNFIKVLALLASGYRTDAISVVGRLVMQPRGLIGLSLDTLDYSGAQIKQVFDVLAADGATTTMPSPPKAVDGDLPAAHYDPTADVVVVGVDDDNNNPNGTAAPSPPATMSPKPTSTSTSTPTTNRTTKHALNTAPSSFPAIIHCTQGKDRTGLLVVLLLLLTRLVPLDVISADYIRSEPELRVDFEDRVREIRAIGLGVEYARCSPGFASAVKAHLDDRYGGVEAYLASIGVGVEAQERIRKKLVAVTVT